MTKESKLISAHLIYIYIKIKMYIYTIKIYIYTDPLYPNENFEQTLDLLGLKYYTLQHSRLFKSRNGF